MKAKIIYGGNTYGNSSNASGYAVVISRGRQNIDIDFKLDKPADGRGVGWQQGSVQRVSLTLPPEACKALAHGLFVALSDVTKGTVDFRIDEEPPEHLAATA